ncbi:MAG: hypothetical protein ACRD6W_19285 [Nitrososphaerales archaeon]
MRKGSTVGRFSDRLVVQGRRAGVLDLSVCLLATPEGEPRGLGLLRPLAAACTSEGIRRDTGIISWLHWPDLVTIDGRVVATASLSLAAPPGPDGKAEAVLRICVNCFAGNLDEFPSALPSTSVLEALGVEIDVDLLRDKVLHALDWYFAEWERGMRRKLVERIEPTISWLGRKVEVRTSDAKVLVGRAEGLDDAGSLLLELRGKTGSDKTRTLAPERVEFVRPVK